MPSYSQTIKNEALIRLAINKYNFKATSEEMGISVRTLRNWEKNLTQKNTVPTLLERAIKHILAIIPEAQGWSPQDMAITLGILLDKWLILNNHPTERSELINTFESLPDADKAEVIRGAKEIISGLSSGEYKPGDNGHSG